jgi:anti-sigma regulatory factor (Ser/Thr protein kinase)
MTTVPRLVHEALLYSTQEEFVAVVAPFLRSAVDDGESALAVTDEANLAALRDALGAAADHVDWADAAAWSPKPIDRIESLHRYVRERLDQGAPRVRIVDESVWPSNSTAAVSELKRFESICNLLFAPLPVWMVCPYNASLFNHILPDAYRTHPVIRDARVSREASIAYLEPGEFFRALDFEHELPDPPSDARLLRFLTAREVRSFVIEEAFAAGLHPDRVRDLELAACEMATNAIRHGDEGGEARVWTKREELVCEVLDAGGGMKDRLAGYGEPSEPALGGWGLLLARKLCDGVEVRSGPGGTVIRLTMKLPGSPHGSRD